MRVLVVDDERDYHTHIEDVLAEFGVEAAQIDHAYSVDEALPMVADSTRWDLYLIDWRFVGSTTTGHAVIETLFRNKPDARVALCTQFDPIHMEPDLVDRISNGRVTLIEKEGFESLFLRRLLDPPRRQRCHILVLEDDPDDAALVSEALIRHSNNQISVDIATSSEQARSLVAAHGFDGYILDYRLPGEGTTGIDFYKSLDEENRRRPAVLFTAHTGLDLDRETVRLIASGDLTFMAKSRMNPERLLSCFRT